MQTASFLCDGDGLVGLGLVGDGKNDCTSGGTSKKTEVLRSRTRKSVGFWRIFCRQCENLSDWLSGQQIEVRRRSVIASAVVAESPSKRSSLVLQTVSPDSFGHVRFAPVSAGIIDRNSKNIRERREGLMRGMSNDS